MVPSAWRRRLHLNTQPTASWRNRSNLTRGRANTLIVGWKSPWYDQPNAVYGDPGCWRTRSVYKKCSGSMEPAYNSSTKERTGNKWNFYFMHSNTQKREKWRPKVFFLIKKMVSISPLLWLNCLPFTLHSRTCHHRYKKGSLDFSRSIRIITSIMVWYYYLKYIFKIKIKHPSYISP